MLQQRFRLGDALREQRFVDAVTSVVVQIALLTQRVQNNERGTIQRQSQR